MEMFNRLKSTLTNVLPGNPLGTDFEVKSHRASGGPGLLWKIYDGIKKTTKEEVSVWEFEKKQLERYSKRDKELIVECLKKGVSQLTRLRHPKILSVLHPLEESRESLAFATEPVFASLANVLGRHENLPSPTPPDIRDHKLYDVEIKYGLLQVTEGLTFLHNDVKLVHCNLCPESIILNKSGSWKIAGFDCCVTNANQGEQNAYYKCTEWTPSIPPSTQPNLDFLAPEYILQSACNTTCDLFSLGVLFYCVFSNGKTLFDCHGELSTYKKNAEQLRNIQGSLLGCVPEDVRDHVKMLLNMEPSVRPDADQLSKIPFFEDVGSMTLQYLDSLFQRDNLQKSQFFKGLPQIIVKMPKRVSLLRILPCLSKECVNADMVPFVLPCILSVAEQATEKEFSAHLLPVLIPLLKITEPVQVLFIFLQNMNLLLSKTPQNDIRNYILPLLYRALESNAPPVQQLCLRIIPTFAELIEYSSIKNAIVPRLRKICLNTTNLSLRVNCLVCLGQLLEYMDKWYVMDDILPILQEVPSREPAVLMSILGIYKVVLEHKKLGMSKDVLANKILPFVMPICIDNNLNLSQFNAYITVVKEMVGKVEAEHRSKLEQLHSMQQEQRTLQFANEPVPDKDTLVSGVGGERKSDSMMDKFLSGFGLSSLMPGSSSESSAVNGESAKKADSAPSMPGPAKTVMTMQEKERMAKQQEQQKQMKSQQPLQTATRGPSTTQQTGTAGKPKDLTSTLINSNLTTMKNSPKTAASGQLGGSNVGTGRGGSMGSGGMGTAGSGMAATGGGMGTGMYAGQIGTGHSSGGGFITSPSGGRTTSYGGSSAGLQSAPSKNVDLSAFDNLLPSSGETKKSLSQMSQAQNAVSQGVFPAMGQQTVYNPQQQGVPGQQRGMMGQQQGMMGQQQGMMGQQHGMMGQQQSMMGHQQQGMMTQQQGMMGQQSVGQPFGGNSMNMGSFAQTNSSQQNQAPGMPKALSSQDISDFLG